MIKLIKNLPLTFAEAFNTICRIFPRNKLPYLTKY